jgi:aryl-alcohol dehydrogenase-like predicted oxidoreductase
MERRSIGAVGRVHPLGLGCVGMSGWYGPVDERECEATLAEAVRLGVELFDTADAYGLGANEELVGRALRAHRRGVRIATKFGNLISADGRLLGVNGRPDYVREACDRSLQRLGVERIDLYYLHRVDPAVPVEETVGAMAELVAAGKVAAIGLSEADAATIRRAHAVHAVSAVESEYSLWSRDAEAVILPLCLELDIAFVAYSPLGRGFFSSSVGREWAVREGDHRRRFPRFEAANFAANLELRKGLEDVATSQGVTMAQLCLGWMLHKWPHLITIPGASRRSHLVDNLGASALRLDQEVIERVERCFEPVAVAGRRFGEQSSLGMLRA